MNIRVHYLIWGSQRPVCLNHAPRKTFQCAMNPKEVTCLNCLTVMERLKGRGADMAVKRG